MITRIVKMTFQGDKVDEFREIFNSSCSLIKAFDGCDGVELKQDIHQAHVFFTISLWKSEEYLNAYRDSYLFRNTWSKVKPLFAEKAEAWSLDNPR